MKHPAFRPSTQPRLWINLCKTVVQVAVLWGVFLVLIPAGILILQKMASVERFDPGLWKWAAFTLFWMAGFTGFHCGWLFIRHGRGTPLPLDSTTEFVVAGVYRHVRNPMAIGGILQGVCVGWWLGSWPVMIYSLCGALVWHVVARPAEEADLSARFGAAYLDYQQSIRCWIPSLHPYQRVLPGDSEPAGQQTVN